MKRGLRKVRSLRALPAEFQLAVVRAFPIALAVEIGLRLLSLPALARLLGVRLGTRRTDQASEVRGSAEMDEAESQSARAVELIFRNWPLGGSCLRKSLVLARVLRKRNPLIRIGVARGEEGLTAHAWVEVEGASIDSASGGFSPLTRGYSDLCETLSMADAMSRKPA